MKIALIKVKSQEIPFDVKADSVSMSGFLKPKSRNLIQLEAMIDAKLTLPCDRCGAPLEVVLHEPLTLLVSDGAYEDINNDFDIIECFDGFVNIDEILDSEINLIKSDYHYCTNCK